MTSAASAPKRRRRCRDEPRLRVREIVRNLCDFARLDRAEWQEVNLNDYLRATLEMLCHELKRKEIGLETRFGHLEPALV